jgi:uncharacterized protein YukE
MVVTLQQLSEAMGITSGNSNQSMSLIADVRRVVREIEGRQQGDFAAPTHGACKSRVNLYYCKLTVCTASQQFMEWMAQHRQEQENLLRVLTAGNVLVHADTSYLP